MPALNPFILKGSLSECSEEVIKLTSLSPERNFFLILKKPLVELGSLETQLHCSFMQRKGLPSSCPEGQEMPARGKDRSSSPSPGLWGGSSSAPPAAKVQWSPMKIFSVQDTTICLPSAYPNGWVYSWVLFFFQYKMSLFCSTAGRREAFEVNNVLCISRRLNEYITFHFDLWLHLRVTIIYRAKMGYLQCCWNKLHEHSSNYLPSLNNYN